MIVVDTNVLVYAANAEVAEHERCRARLERLRASALPWFLTWSIVYEFLRVVTHRNVLARPLAAAEAWEFVAALLASPSLSVLVPTPRHPRLVAETFRQHPHLRGNLLHDAHTAILMREHGVRAILTRDRDFLRFPFVEMVDPLEG